MNLFSNTKIAKKLGLVFGGAVLLLICVATLAIWATHAIHKAMNASESQGRMMVLAQKIAAGQGAIAQRVATMTLSKWAGPEIMTQLLGIRTDYMAAFNELRPMVTGEKDSACWVTWRNQPVAGARRTISS